MRFCFFFFAGFLFFHINVASAWSSADCILDLTALTSPIDHSAGSVKTIQAPELDAKNRRFSHIVQLSSGAMVEFSAGGCVHYGFSYKFSQLQGIPVEKGELLFAFIHQQIRLLPLKNGEADRLEKILNALQQAAATTQNWQTPTELSSPFGDASAVLSLKPDGFVLSYDFPL